MAQTSFVKFSEQRRAVMDFVAASLTHPSADEIFSAIRKRLPKISLGTVYRNLEQLEQLGLIHKIEYKKDFVRYDAIMDPHDHFVCEVCDKVENVYLPELPELRKKAEKELGATVTDYRLYLFGRCRKCLR